MIGIFSDPFNRKITYGTDQSLCGVEVDYKEGKRVMELYNGNLTS